MKTNIFHITFAVALLSLAFVSCSEDIDESARYTFTQETLIDYIRNNAEFSEYAKMLDQTDITEKISEGSRSKVSQLLSARGSFVVFAPTNWAIRDYLKKVAQKQINGKNIIDETETDSLGAIKDKSIADSLRKVIVLNSVIDFASNSVDNFMYMSNITNTGNDPKTLDYNNLNNRRLTTNKKDPNDANNTSRSYTYKDDEGVEHEVSTTYWIEGARTIDVDLQVYNGVLHIMNEVVAPSNDKVNNVMANTENLHTFAALLDIVGLSDTLSVTEDETYSRLYWSNPTKYAPPAHKTQGNKIKGFEERLYGFTIFPETDELYSSIGVTGIDATSLANLKAYLQSQNMGTSACTISWDDDDYTATTNWLNYFVTYHILPMRIEYEYLVVHYNETGYRWGGSATELTLLITEHYATMGERRMLNISDGLQTGKVKHLNYFAKMDRKDPRFLAKGETVKGPAIPVPNPVGITSPLNGAIYPIEQFLVYTQEVANLQGNMRMRIDVTTLFPELMNNSVRRRNSNIGDYGFTSEYAFLDNMTWTKESNVYYFPGYNSEWHNIMGDEFNITGIYDVTIKMPPVPVANTYELRIGVSINPTRGMMQVYYGSNPNALPAAGIPLDMRVGGITKYQDWNGSQKSNSNIGWEIDTDDEVYNEEVDKKLRQQGFMKAPAGYCKSPAVGSMAVENTLRNYCESYGAKGNCLRRIILTQRMSPEETYYIRFKDVLGNENSQFFLDYFELVPKEIYDNPLETEDIW